MRSDTQARLDAIWARRRPQVLERIDEVDRAAAALRTGAPDPDTIEAGRAAAHRLAGSLGMFGSPAGSACASRLEALLGPGADPVLAAQLAAELRATVPPAADRPS